MNIGEMKEMFEKIHPDTVLQYGISEPFSWRGAYDEVCFSVEPEVTIGECLKRIDTALDKTFYGYKGGEYKYCLWTPVNFEQSGRDYTDGEYREDTISKILGDTPEYDRDAFLVKVMMEG